MPHIHTQPGQHDHTVSAFIIRTDLKEPTVLFHLHKKVGKLLQPGGHIELHETLWQSILHEIIEETGFSHTQLQILQPKARVTRLTGATLHPLPLCQNTHVFSQRENQHFHTDTCYIFIADTKPEGYPQEGESTDLRWLTREQMLALSEGEIGQNSREIALFALGVPLQEWDALDLSEFAA